MFGSKKLLQCAVLAIACTLFLAASLGSRQSVEPQTTGVASTGVSNPRQMLEQLSFAKRAILLVDGHKYDIWTGARTVEEAIRAAGVELGALDRSEPCFGNAVVDNMQIEVIRVKQELVHEEVETPYETKKIASRSLNRGQTKEVRPGVKGKILNTYQVTMENGKVIERDLVKSETLVEKQDRLLEEGVVATIARGGQNLRYSKVLDVVATAYTADYDPKKGAPDDPWLGMTASGKRAVAGLTIATDPRVIPMHSKVYVEGVDAHGKKYSGTYVAMDTGGAVKGNRIDIFMSTYNEAIRFGRRKMRVYVLE